MSEIKDDDGQTATNFTTLSEPPYSFGIGLAGELVIGYCQPGTFGLLRMHLEIPASELHLLRRLLVECKDVQETLAAQPPTRSKH